MSPAPTNDPDAAGRLHPRQDLLYRNLQAPGEAALAQAMMGARAPGHVSYGSALSGKEEIAGFAPVADHHWVVGVSKSRPAFDAPLNPLFVHLVLSVALVGLLFVVLALRFARGIAAFGSHRPPDFSRAWTALA